MNVELVNPSIAKQFLEEEKAVFDSTVFGSTNYQRSETIGTGDTSRSQSSQVGIEKPLTTGGLIQLDMPFNDDYTSGGLAQVAASVSFIQSLRRIYAFADYEIAQINLARATGTLLGQEQIQMASTNINSN